MNIPSHETTNSITILVYSPLVSGGSYIRVLDNEIDSYSHVISVVGGFLSSTITLKVSDDAADEWLSKGLGRHIVARGTGGEIVWEGFVDNISVGMGNITIERGRLTEICNRCSVLYTPIEEYDDAGNPIGGTEISSLIADDSESILKYGIWEGVISGGLLLDDRDPVTLTTPAENLRNAYLEDNREPEISHSPILITEGGSDLTVTLDCKGYIEWLTYVYNNTTEVPFSTDVTTKILKVLTEDPNDIISTDVSNIDYNGVLIGMPEDQSRTALEIIDEAVEMGGPNYERWIFGIYENQIPHFHSFSSTIDYRYYISEGNQKILNLGGAEIQPWNVRPGKLILIQDTYLGGFSVLNTRTDPRVMYLEQITFTAPQTLNLEGKKVHVFEQMLNQYGLVGGP